MCRQPMLRQCSQIYHLIRWAALAVLCFQLVSCSASHPRFILLIIVDTVRADHIGCYGYESIHTPNIDRLAEEGVLYENAVTTVPVTLPSISTILTGAYPVQHGLRDNGPFQLGERWTTLAECLHEAGYATGAFVSAAVLSKEHNLTQGFDIYDDDVSMPYVPYHPWMITMQEQFQGIERRAQETVDRTLKWAKARSDQKVFLMVHLFDPHLPYDPPPPFRESYRRFYDGEIAYADQEIGRLLDELRKQREPSDMVTILIADHGEGLNDHDEAHHGDLLFEETVRVPLIVHGGKYAPGTRVSELVRTVDILPTICALAGIAAPRWSTGGPLPGMERNIDGKNMRRDGLHGRTAYIETFRPRLSHGWCELRGIRSERWKLIEGPGYELYDLLADPGESDNVAGEHGAVVDSLARLMDEVAFAAVRRGSHFAESLELSRQQRKKLQSLGYVTPEKSRVASSDSLAVWYFPPEERGPALGLPHPRDRLIASVRNDAARSHFRVAYAALQKNNIEEAENNFREAIRNKGGFTEAYIGLAEVARRRGRSSEETLTFLQQARDTHPEDPGVIRLLADAFVRMDREDNALQIVDEAIAEGFADSALIDLSRTLHKQLDDAAPGTKD
jgi:arylsulfatase A-like enzyme